MDIVSKKLEIFGLDISERSLKMAKLAKTNNNVSLVSFAEADIPKGIVVDSAVRDVSILSDLIRKVLSRAHGKKVKDRHVVVSLPEEKSFLDVIQIPFVEEEELSSAVQFEAANHIPMAFEDAYFDFEVITRDNKKKLQEVLIAAIPREIVDSYLNALKAAKLQPIAMEIECLSVARALVKDGFSKSPILIIDFGATRSSFMIFFKNSLRFTSTIPISSISLTDSIAKVLNVTPKKAEALKQEKGLIGEKEVARAMTPILTDLARQINEHLSYYRSHTFKSSGLKQNHKLGKILLSGGAANLKGLPEFLSDKLNMKVEIGNPWVNILKESIREVPALSFEKSLSYATALGLALRGLDAIDQ